MNDQSRSSENTPKELAATFVGGARPEQAGGCIGPYKLLQKIGEGGFGVVYMAKQDQPVRRVVALKIIKPGMDSAQVIARFESERQALALMDHPNVAKVLDAGATQSGHPYFVMELVKGVPITEFCDKNHMPPEERLELFLDVCHAIQHAHQKGVIHRDIKPSNVMVSLHGGMPGVKVIDFGVAKATAQKLTERTLFTAYGQMVGTPAYMSPEQAEMSGLDVDTRTDVYSLGVLLYELLTGTTPLEVGAPAASGLRGNAAPDPRGRDTAAQHSTVVTERFGDDPGRILRPGLEAADLADAAVSEEVDYVVKLAKKYPESEPARIWLLGSANRVFHDVRGQEAQSRLFGQLNAAWARALSRTQSKDGTGSSQAPARWRELAGLYLSVAAQQAWSHRDTGYAQTCRRLWDSQEPRTIQQHSSGPPRPAFCKRGVTRRASRRRLLWPARRSRSGGATGISLTSRWHLECVNFVTVIGQNRTPSCWPQ